MYCVALQKAAAVLVDHSRAQGMFAMRCSLSAHVSFRAKMGVQP